jgi:Flp pilus assembly pilin Flp
MSRVVYFLRSEGGATAAEYAALLGLVLAAFVASAAAFRPVAADHFESAGGSVGTYGVGDPAGPGTVSSGSGSGSPPGSSGSTGKGTGGS